MNIALLKGKTDKANIITQQNAIIKYAKHSNISLDSTEIEGSDSSKMLEEKQELKGFLRSLNENDNLLIYDLWVFTEDVGELTKILECLLVRNISIFICNLNFTIEVNTPALEVLTILAQYREKNLVKNKENVQGRPKGRMSKSKFDNQRTEIIKYLEDGDSVSQIARTLSVSRTSLKDYINSRGLKDLVAAKKTLLTEEKTAYKKPRNSNKQEECSLIKGIN
jgi:DNA invertase Pin-like site-specific DNA recombinase